MRSQRVGNGAPDFEDTIVSSYWFLGSLVVLRLQLCTGFVAVHESVHGTSEPKDH
jgi:hypothetical protein